MSVFDSYVRNRKGALAMYSLLAAHVSTWTTLCATLPRAIRSSGAW